MFNPDGSYQELTTNDEGDMVINKTKKYLTKPEEGGGKIYRVLHTYNNDRDEYDASITVVSEHNYVNKIYADQICKLKNEEIEKVNAGRYNPHKGSVHVKEVDVVFNPDGSYREITYKGARRFPDEEIY
jgi:hypothetical protein